MPDPIVIVDARGTEHEFPSGFDPIKAAGIVRSQAGGTESGTYAGGFFNSLADTTRRTVQAAGSAVTANLSPAAWWAAMQEKKKADNPSPAEWAAVVKAANAPVSLANIRQNVADRVQGAKDDLATLSTPEGGGKEIGNLGMMLATGRAPEIASGARVPLGKGLNALGGGLQTVADSKAVQRLSSLGAIGEGVMKGDFTKAAALAAGPTVMKYGGMGVSKLGDLLQGVADTPSSFVMRDPATGRFAKAGSVKPLADLPEAYPGGPRVTRSTTAAKQGTVGEMLVDPRQQAVMDYAGPERRVSGAAARASWEERNLLDRFGGTARIPSSVEIELAQKLGQPGDAEMAMAISNRNAGTRWQPTAPSSSVRVPVTLNDAMAAAVRRKVKK